MPINIDAKFVIAAVSLVALTVAVHTIGLSLLIRGLMRTRAFDQTGFWRVTRFMIGLTCSLLLIHLFEIAGWGFFYFREGCLPDLQSAMYFSGVTYTTVGYGDLVLTGSSRMLAPVEALTGILMCGLSTGLFFAMVTRCISNWMRRLHNLEAAPKGDSVFPGL